MRLAPIPALLAAVAFLAPGSTTSAESMGLRTADEAKALCQSAAETFGKGQVQAAFDSLAAHWPLPKEEVDSMAIESRKQLGLVGGRFGAYVGIEPISTTQAGNSFLRHLFAVKYENHALRFTCAFYKPHERWLVNSFNWDDKPFQPIDPSSGAR
jgi:hypothetical protein